MKLSLIAPCYNEEKNVKPFYDEICKTFNNFENKLEIVFINDGSHDNTYEELVKITKASNKKIAVKVVNFSRNFGKEAAMYAGLKETSGDMVAIIDTDLQQDPHYVLDMISFLEKNPDYDSVAMCQEERREGAILGFFKRTFYKIINKISEVNFINGASDFRLLKRNMVDAILSMQEYHRFSKGIFSWVGFNTHYMPYKVKDRVNGNTSWSFWKLFKYALDGIVAFTVGPLRIATITGIISSITSMIYLIFVVIQKLAFGIAVPGHATIVVLILLIGGIQLFGLGIIGEYLARTYVEAKKRPIYIAKNIISNEKDK